MADNQEQLPVPRDDIPIESGDEENIEYYGDGRSDDRPPHPGGAGAEPALPGLPPIKSGNEPSLSRMVYTLRTMREIDPLNLQASARELKMAAQMLQRPQNIAQISEEDKLQIFQNVAHIFMRVPGGKPANVHARVAGLRILCFVSQSSDNQEIRRIGQEVALSSINWRVMLVYDMRFGAFALQRTQEVLAASFGELPKKTRDRAIATTKDVVHAASFTWHSFSERRMRTRMSASEYRSAIQNAGLVYGAGWDILRGVYDSLPMKEKEGFFRHTLTPFIHRTIYDPDGWNERRRNVFSDAPELEAQFWSNASRVQEFFALARDPLMRQAQQTERSSHRRNERERYTVMSYLNAIATHHREDPAIIQQVIESLVSYGHMRIWDEFTKRWDVPAISSLLNIGRQLGGEQENSVRNLVGRLREEADEETKAAIDVTVKTFDDPDWELKEFFGDD